MEEKIIQIIPAPDNIYALYKDDDDPENPMEIKVVCFALTDQGDVLPMDMDNNGVVGEVQEVTNFIGFTGLRNK